MAIESPHTTNNQVFGNYFRINRVEMEFAPRDPIPRIVAFVAFYVSAYARDIAPEAPVKTYDMLITVEELKAMGVMDPRDWLYQVIQTKNFNGIGSTPEMIVHEDIPPQIQPPLSNEQTTIPASE